MRKKIISNDPEVDQLCVYFSTLPCLLSRFFYQLSICLFLVRPLRSEFGGEYSGSEIHSSGQQPHSSIKLAYNSIHQHLARKKHIIQSRTRCVHASKALQAKRGVVEFGRKILDGQVRGEAEPSKLWASGRMAITWDSRIFSCSLMMIGCFSISVKLSSVMCVHVFWCP